MDSDLDMLHLIQTWEDVLKLNKDNTDLNEFSISSVTSHILFLNEKAPKD